MKQRRRKFLPALRSGRFYGCFHDVKEGFLLCTASMLVQSIMYRFFAQHSHSMKWAAHEEPVARSNQLAITWIGHSTYLIQIAGINILTDPIFGNASIFYPRIISPGIPLKKMPNIDIILISHNHIDHMEGSSLRVLMKHPEVTILTPHGDKRWFDSYDFLRMHEHSWWDQQTITVGGNPTVPVRCTFLPAAHWSQRGLFDRNRSLWGSWMIECNNICIYFAGDTAYGVHFGEIAQEFPKIDVGLMPIGPCEPREWMKHSHMDAAEAGHAFLELNAQHFFPMHWGTFHFGHEPADLPILRMRQWWHDHEESLQEKKLFVPKIGQRILV